MLYLGLGIFMRKGDLTFCMSRNCIWGGPCFAFFFFFSFFPFGKGEAIDCLGLVVTRDESVVFG